MKREGVFMGWKYFWVVLILYPCACKKIGVEGIEDKTVIHYQDYII